MKEKYYSNIKEYLVNNEIYKKVKDYSKNKSDLVTYYNVGKELAEAGKHYGNNIIKEYSNRLTIDVGKGYGVSNLKRMRQFYYMIEKGVAMPHQLSWSHVLFILPLKNIDEINYYINVAINNNYGYRELGRRIKNKEYDRIPIEYKCKVKQNDKIEIKDLVPNPILIKNKNNIEIINEKILHQLVLEDITGFMKELGNGFSFIDREYKIKIGDRFNYIDILLFNIKFNAYVVVELKVTEFKVEYISQVQKYMNYIDKNIKEISNNNTIGILICKKENKFMIEYCLDDRIAIREYELV